MRVARFVLSIVLSSSFPFPSASQQASAPAPNSSPQAATLLSQSAAALSGNIALSDVTLSGTVRRIAGSDDESGSVVLTATASGSSKIALSFSSGNRKEVRTNSNNSPTGSWSGTDSIAHSIAVHNLFTDWGLFPTFTFSNLNGSATTVFSYIGQETRNGHSVQHLSIQQQFPNQTGSVASLLQHLSQMDIYLDASTSLPVSLAYNIHPDNDADLDLPVEIGFSDYRPVNGAQIPFHVQKYLNNNLSLDLQFQSVAVNSGLTTNSFSL
jgi:hypothetical protein